MGAGRTEIMETLFGLRKAVSGSIELEGKKVEIKNPSDAVACGFALVPEDRRKEGLVLSHTIKENAILPISAQLVKMGYLMMIRQHMISLKKISRIWEL